LLGHGTQLGIDVLEHFPRAIQIGPHLAVIPVGENNRLHFGVFLGRVAELVLVADHSGLTEHRGTLSVAVRKTAQLPQQRWLHFLASSRANCSGGTASASRRPSAVSRLSCTLGACSSWLVRPRAMWASTSSALPPFCSRR